MKNYEGNPINHREYISLKEFFEKLFREKEIGHSNEHNSLDIQIKSLEKEMILRNDKIETSTDLAFKNIDHKLESMNGIYHQMKEQENTFVKKLEFDIQHQRVVEDVKILMSNKDNMAGRASVNSVYFGYAIGIIGIIIALIALFIR